MPFDWEMHNTKLEIYKNLFNNQFLADVKFIFPQPNNINPKIIYSHSFLLTIHSSTFHKTFYGPNEATYCKFNDYYELVITDINYYIFYEFINYFYNNLAANKSSIKQHARARSNNLYYLLKLAHDYNVIILEKLILSYFDKYLKNNINFNTIINTLLISNLPFVRYGKTFTKSLTFVKRNLYQFLKMKLLSELDRNGLEILLRFDDGDYWTNEIDIYQAVIVWIEKQNEFDHNAGNYREVLGERFMKLIRFPTMCLAQFKKVVAFDVPKLLKDNEIRRLFSYISNGSYGHDNEVIDLCGYNHVPRKKIKQWKDCKLCQTFAPYDGESKCCRWCAGASLVSVVQGVLFIFPYVN